MLDIIKNKHFLPNIKPTLYFVPNSKLFPHKKRKKKKKKKKKKKEKKKKVYQKMLKSK